MEHRTDVVVVGAGPAGMAAALEAAAGGAKVTLLEASERIGGNAYLSTGYLAFLDSAHQREAGIDDSEDAFMADSLAEVALQEPRYGMLFDELLTRQFIRQSRDTYEWLTGLGLRFNRFIPRPRQHRTERMLDVTDTKDFERLFAPALERAGVDVVTGTRVTRLGRTEESRVGQVSAVTDGGETLTVNAGRAVVLTAGGYQGNPSLRVRYQPRAQAFTPYLGMPTCRGDAHIMGMEIGADLVNMTMLPMLVVASSAMIEDSIAVNLEGRRFHDEAGPYEDRADALLAQPEATGYYVFDAVTARLRETVIAQLPETPVSAPTLAGLAEAIGTPASAFEETVVAWNRMLEGDTDRDPDFGRVILPRDRRGIRTGPFYAGRMVVGANFGSGGFRVTSSMAVVDVASNVIPGLYAAGDCVAGVNPSAGLGGIHICSALTLGRVAGRAAAHGDTGEPTTLSTRAAGPGPLDGIAQPVGSRVEIMPLH